MAYNPSAIDSNYTGCGYSMPNVGEFTLSESIHAEPWCPIGNGKTVAREYNYEFNVVDHLFSGGPAAGAFMSQFRGLDDPVINETPRHMATGMGLFPNSHTSVCTSGMSGRAAAGSDNGATTECSYADNGIHDSPFFVGNSYPSVQSSYSRGQWGTSHGMKYGFKHMDHMQSGRHHHTESGQFSIDPRDAQIESNYDVFSELEVYETSTSANSENGENEYEVNTNTSKKATGVVAERPSGAYVKVEKTDKTEKRSSRGSPKENKKGAKPPKVTKEPKAKKPKERLRCKYQCGVTFPNQSDLR